MTCFVAGFEVQSMIFMHYTPSFQCQDANESITWVSRATYELISNASNMDFAQFNNTTPPQQCWGFYINPNSGEATRFQCSRWAYDTTQMKRTVVTQFNLVCERKWWVPSMEAVYLFFSAVGYLVAFLGDTLGRRLPFLAFSAWGILVCLATPFANSIPLLVFLRGCRGMSTALSYLGIQIVSELVPVSRREVYGNLYWTLWAFGYIVCAGTAVLLRDWVKLRLWYCAFLSVYLVYPVFVCESPRWLCMRGEKKKAINILRRIAKWNNAKLPEDYFVKADLTLEYEYTQSTKPITSITDWIPGDKLIFNTSSESLELESPMSTGGGSEFYNRTDKCFDIIKFPNLRKYTLVFCIAHSAITMVYFGLITDSFFATENIFLNVFLMGLMELPTSFAGWGVSVYFGRRIATSSLLVLTGITVVIVKLSSSSFPIVSTVAALVCKFAISVVYCVSDLYITEVYPTTVRVAGFFTIISVAGVFSAIAPFINNLTEVHILIPCTIYSIASISGAITVHRYLPETRNCPLAQSVSEAEQLIRGKEAEWIIRKRHENCANPRNCQPNSVVGSEANVEAKEN
ncbi:unnamed protein product [Dicrocoelium dendriticum]|nr:unnamed protein product [Dicrocoelium dendriticum]